MIAAELKEWGGEGEFSGDGSRGEFVVLRTVAVDCAALSLALMDPNGQAFAVGSEDGVIRIVVAEKPHEKLFLAHATILRDAAVTSLTLTSHHSKPRLISATSAGPFEIWDPSRAVAAEGLPARDLRDVVSLRFSAALTPIVVADGSVFEFVVDEKAQRLERRAIFKSEETLTSLTTNSDESQFFIGTLHGAVFCVANQKVPPPHPPASPSAQS